MELMLRRIMMFLTDAAASISRCILFVFVLQAWYFSATLPQAVKRSHWFDSWTYCAIRCRLICCNIMSNIVIMHIRMLPFRRL